MAALSGPYENKPPSLAQGRNGAAMCEKCTELDKKIRHYKDLAARVMDDPFTQRVEAIGCRNERP